MAWMLKWLLCPILIMSLLYSARAGFSYSCGDLLCYLSMDPPGGPVPNDIPPNVGDLKLNDLGLTDLGTFGNFDQLVKFTLEGNSFEEFPDLTNASLVLEELNLRQNLLLNIKPERLQTLSNVKMLYLEGNKLSSIPDVGNMMLEELELSFNQFTEVPSLEKLGNSLKTLKLSNNFIFKITKKCMAGLNNLTSLYINQNNIKEFPNFSLIGANLKRLHIDGNIIETIPRGLVAVFEQLDDLRISWNKLVEFPDLTPLAKTLVTLFVGGNLEITHIPRDRLIPLENLDHFDMAVGSLTHLPNVCSMKNKLTTAAFFIQPFVCDCHMRWIKMAQLEGLYKTLDFMVNCLDKTPVQLECNDPYQRVIEPRPLDDDYYCPLVNVTSSHYAEGLIDCAALCMAFPTCPYFRYEDPASISDVNCDITDITLGYQGYYDHTMGSWYSVE